MHAAALTFLNTMKPNDIGGRRMKGPAGSFLGGISGRVRLSTRVNTAPLRFTSLQNTRNKIIINQQHQVYNNHQKLKKKNFFLKTTGEMSK